MKINIKDLSEGIHVGDRFEVVMTFSDAPSHWDGIHWVGFGVDPSL